MFEITTRPPNSYLLQQLQQQQHQRSRNQTIQFRSPRSSSVSSPVTSFTSTTLDKHFPQFFLHNDINNLTLINNSNNANLNNMSTSTTNDYVYSSFPSNTASSKLTTNDNSDRYVTRILTNGGSNTDNRLKKLVSTSSTSYFHDLNNSNSNLNTISNCNTSKSTSGTVLPVFYQNESTGQTSTLNSQLPTLRYLTVTASKPPISYKNNTNPLPTLNNSIGSATSIVSVSNNNNNNTNNNISSASNSYRHLKPQITSLHSSFSNLNDDYSVNRFSSKPTYNIPVKQTDLSEYKPKLTAKQYSVIKGIKARQEMLSSSSSSASSASSLSTNIINNTSNKIDLDQSRPLNKTNDSSSIFSRQSSFASSTGSLNNLSSSTSTNITTSTTPATKSILVNKKRFANPSLNKKTVSFANLS